MSKKFLTPLNLMTASNDPSVGKEGDMYFNTQDKSIRIHNGTVWVTIIKSDDPIPFYEHTHNYDGDVSTIFPIALPLSEINDNIELSADGGTVSSPPTMLPGFTNSLPLDGGIVD
jgi:hypothetical protein